jgi:hypothetical protein
MKISFKNWLLIESKDIFGFEKPKNNQVDTYKKEENPIIPISIELMMDQLLKFNLNEQKPFSKFINHVQWGKHNGATQMVVSPLGSFKSIIRRLQTDLEGNDVWICKNILPYKDVMEANLRIDDNLAYLLFEKIEQANEKQLESAIGDYVNLENITLKLMQQCQKPEYLPKLFIFKGAKEIKANEHYIIYFEIKGHGVEAPGANRVEMFAINMSYNPKSGIIRSTGNEIQSPIKGHKWIPVPSEWDEYFSPAQPNEEIINSICGALRTY